MTKQNRHKAIKITATVLVIAALLLFVAPAVAGIAVYNAKFGKRID